MLRSVDISDYMIHRPVKIHAEDDMSTAIGLVLDNKISGICVVNEHGDLVGVLSEMDCLKAILNAILKTIAAKMRIFFLKRCRYFLSSKARETNLIFVGFVTAIFN